ncbi:hypothetical protein L9F63_012445, partial [Diploptera punctata]
CSEVQYRKDNERMRTLGVECTKIKTEIMAKYLQCLYQNHVTKKFVHSLLFDPNYLTFASICLLLGELIVNFCIIHYVKYTEIDWIAYMQEVEGVVNGTYDYTYLKGDTGPLVYPAGFVYIFTILYYITSNGKNVRLAQYVFAVLHIIFLMLIFRIYIKSKIIPPYVLVLMCSISYRIHSIFVLRLFNDTVAMLLFYASVNLFLNSRWNLASVFYSLAVSVKMNILLFAPAVLLTYLKSLGLKHTVKQLAICAFVQCFLGLPFLITNPGAYIRGAFNLGRVFLHEWTVNWRFLPENIFTNFYFHISLLSLHIMLLLIFFTSPRNNLQKLAYSDKQLKVNSDQTQHDAFITSMKSHMFLLPLFTANFIGIACSRSLHYQFYVWYFHSVPYLLWSIQFPTVLRILILLAIEICWNTFPSTCLSSMTLHLCHILILLNHSTTMTNKKYLQDTLDDFKIESDGYDNTEPNLNCTYIKQEKEFTTEQDSEQEEDTCRSRVAVEAFKFENIDGNQSEDTFFKKEILDVSQHQSALFCEYCGKSFYSKYHLIRHMHTHTGERPYKCEYCKKGFCDKYTLKTHIRIHNGDKDVKCLICGKTFIGQYHLTLHSRIHSGVKPYSCGVCNKSFSQKSSLRTHIRTHTGEMPFFCEFCKKAFSQKSHLNVHVLIHTNERPYKCGECNKTFPDKNHLTRHIIIVHTRELKFTCKVCNKSFSYKQNLTRHNRVHTGERPYPCDICSKAFSVKSNLNSHKRIHARKKLV